MGKYLVIKGTSFANVAVCKVDIDSCQLIASHTSAELTDGYYNNANKVTPHSSPLSKCIKYALDNIDEIVIEGGIPAGGFFYSSASEMITSDAESYNTFEVEGGVYVALVPDNATHIAINFTNTENTYTNLVVNDYRENE